MDTSDRFRIEGDSLLLGAAMVGPATALYAAPGELATLGERDGVVHTTTTRRVDLVFAAGSKVVGVELKRGGDFVGSLWRGRLARQLTTMGALCDVVVLGLSSVDAEALEAAAKDLVCYQAMGVLVVFLPSVQRDQARALASMKLLFEGSTALLRPFTWTDATLRPRRGSQGWLLRDIPGVGPKLSAKLLDAFGSVGAALEASDAAWREVGVNRKVLEARREALK